MPSPSSSATEWNSARLLRVQAVRRSLDLRPILFSWNERCRIRRAPLNDRGLRRTRASDSSSKLETVREAQDTSPCTTGSGWYWPVRNLSCEKKWKGPPGWRTVMSYRTPMGIGRGLFAGSHGRISFWPSAACLASPLLGSSADPSWAQSSSSPRAW